MADAPRTRRWPWILAALAVLLALGGWWINRQLEPQRLTALVLARAGAALGLELTIDGMPEYALRPEPRLVLPRLVVRQPGAATPVLTAARAEVSLPWDTILGGESLVITRVGLERPVLDLAALAAWQATRPAAPFELPTLTRGLSVREGRVVGADWTLEALALDLPELRPGQAANASLAGTYRNGTTTLSFDGKLSAATAGLASPLQLQAKGRLRKGDIDAPWSLDFKGAYDARGEHPSVDIAALALDSESPLPDMTAAGRVVFGEPTTIALKGELPSWPGTWPVLPAPLPDATAPLAYALAYQGAADFSAPLHLEVVREQTRVDSHFVLPELLAWLDADAANPLPPLLGTVETPSLVIGGATLDGVKVQFEDDAAPADAPRE